MSEKARFFELHTMSLDNPTERLTAVDPGIYELPTSMDVRIFDAGIDVGPMHEGKLFQISDDLKAKPFLVSQPLEVSSGVHPEGVVRVIKQLEQGKYLVEVLPD